MPLASGTPSRHLREHLAQIRPAIEPIITRLWEEHRNVQALEATIARATREMNEAYTYVERARLWDDDDDGVATMVYWDTYFGADKEQHDSRAARDTLEQQLARHSEKRAVESAALLQNAKQCISLLYGSSRDGAPVGGRTIAGTPLRNIIWEGRNQSLHWEDGKFNPPVHSVFSALRKAFPARFDDYMLRNKAFEVVDVLGWKTWDAYYEDVMTFA